MPLINDPKRIFLSACNHRIYVLTHGLESLERWCIHPTAIKLIFLVIELSLFDRYTHVTNGLNVQQLCS